MQWFKLSSVECKIQVDLGFKLIAKNRSGIEFRFVWVGVSIIEFLKVEGIYRVVILGRIDSLFQDKVICFLFLF